MHSCGEVDFAELDRPTFAAAVEIPVRCDQLFEILVDAQAWPRWLSALKKVTWTTPDPKGIGTTRTVEIEGDMLVTEEFIVWEDNQRMAFRFADCSRPLFRSFAEDYRIAATNEGCRLTWSVLIRPRVVPEPALRLGGPLMALILRRYLSRLRAYAIVRCGA